MKVGIFKGGREVRVRRREKEEEEEGVKNDAVVVE